MEKACYNEIRKYSFQAKIGNEIFTVVSSRCRFNLRFIFWLLLVCLFLRHCFVERVKEINLSRAARAVFLVALLKRIIYLIFSLSVAVSVLVA